MTAKERGKSRVQARWLYVLAVLWSVCWLIIQFEQLYRQQEELLRRLPKVSEPAWLGVLQSAGFNDLALYVGIVLLLHLLYAWVNVAAFKSLLAPHLLPRQRITAFVAQLVMVTFTLCLAVAWLYPLSLSGDLFALLLVRESGVVIAGMLAVACTIYFATWLVRACIGSPIAASVAVLSLFLLLVPGCYWSAERQGADTGKPDIVVIGVDSLRPDHLAFNGAPFNVMPTVDRLLKRSIVFSDTISTQPHTYPATVSVLTGRWPTNSGARGNLFPRERVSIADSMAFEFSRAGYQTAFAMDETRFANIDEAYGFDLVLSPDMGVSEMAVGVLADNVLGNLLAMAPVSRVLMPQVYGNRALSAVYRPSAFSKRLARGVGLLDPDAPVFMYVHFCAGHWPYQPPHLYGNDAYSQMPTGDYDDVRTDYLRALGTADDQVARFLDDLEEAGRLKNAVVVLMSDHGEDFGLQKDEWPEAADMPGRIVNGHGGSAIRSPQVSVLLSWLRLGAEDQPGAVRTNPASLVDIAPTVMKLAGIEDQRHDARDGIDLLADLDAHAPSRLRFVESSYYPGALKQSEIDEAAVLREMAEMYRVNAAGRVEVKPDWVDYQIAKRQRAVYLGSWSLMAAEDPQDGLLVVDRQARRYWKMGEEPVGAPTSQLKQAWCQHWRADDVTRLFCGAASAGGASVGAN